MWVELEKRENENKNGKLVDFHEPRFSALTLWVHSTKKIYFLFQLGKHYFMTQAETLLLSSNRFFSLKFFSFTQISFVKFLVIILIHSQHKIATIFAMIS